MSNLSLLVDCKKIIQWLQDRKKLTKDWYNYVKAAEEKIKILLKEKDEFNRYPELIEIINKNHENFCFQDVNIFVENLLRTDMAKEKSILFGYADKRVKQWVNLKKFMDSKNVGLLSNAKFIEQALKFDLPGLDKNIQMMDSQLGMLKRKIDFNQNTIYQQQIEMNKEISNVGLEIGSKEELRRFNIESQIPVIINKVPETMRQVQQLVVSSDVQKLVRIYRERVQKQGSEIQLPMLEHFIRFGNDYVDVYKGTVIRQNYPSDQNDTNKYRQFTHWQPVNQWEIQIQLDTNSNANEFGIEQVKLNYVTIIENRQTRQELLYNLNELMYFYIGTRTELINNTKKLDHQHSTMTESQLSIIISNIQNIICLLNSKLLLTPIQLKNNKHSYQYFVTKFHNIQKNVETLINQIKDYEVQIQQINEERNLQVQKLRALRTKLITVKKQQEKLLTQLVAKQVKIVGEINKLQ